MTAHSSVPEIFMAFLRLGLVSFGGPVAHLSFFHAEFVERRKWLDEQAYADVVALCQFLPGPASSQVGFTIGMTRGGLPGAVAAWLGFTLPSALLMIGFAYGVSNLDGLGNAGWLHGLKIAAAAVVTQAVWSMATKLCPDRARVTLAFLGAMAALAWPFAASQVLIIGAGALAGWVLFWNKSTVAPVEELPVSRGRSGAMAALAAFFILIVGLPLWLAAWPHPALASFEGFYRTGSLVFGGGHVVLPLLTEHFVIPGMVSKEDFLAGYGAVQAVPGPLFTFAAYLGTLMHPNPGRWLGGLWALVAIYLPSALLLLGVIPFWEKLRQKPWAQAALKGANAVVVGLLLAALFHLVAAAGILRTREFILALAAFGLLSVWKWPPWLVVVLSAAAGFFLLSHTA